MPQYWSYEIGQRVRINDKAEIFYPDAIGKVGHIEELLMQGVVDYGVRTLDNRWYRLRENEVELISSINNLNIAFTGWGGSGKSEAANYLVEKYGYHKLSFADGIKWIDREIFGSKEKNRLRLQGIGESLREVDKDVWVNHTMRRLSKTQSNVIDDLRRMNEYNELLKYNFLVIRVVADEDLRVKRLIERDGQCDVSLLYNEAENGCAHLNLIEIHNNGDLEYLHSQIDNLIESWREEDFV